MTTLEYKTATVALVSVKADQPGMLAPNTREIAGYASVFGGPPDSANDIIERGAYDLTLKRRPSVPLLYQHDANKPIGKTTLLAEDDHGLLFKAVLSHVPDADTVLELVADGVITTMSIGYFARKTHKGMWEGKPARWLDEIDLFEISPVTFAARSDTSVSLSKAAILEALALAEAKAAGNLLEVARLELLRELKRAIVPGAGDGAALDPGDLDHERMILLEKIRIAEAEAKRR
jgi:HK97 family phage prohead protease